VNLSSSTEASKIEFQDASAYMQNKLEGNPIVLLKLQAKQLPFPVNQWVNEIANNSLALLLQGAKQEINNAWQTTVMPVYSENIQGRFPFNTRSEAYVTLANFADFFGNGGILPQFIQRYLMPFINTARSPWAQYQVGGYTLGLSQSTLMALEKADAIRRMYFPNNTKNPSVLFSIQPRVLDFQSSSVSLQLANQSFTYRHGPQQIYAWNWPATGDFQQVSIAFNDFLGKTSSETLAGPWAWFSLINSAQLKSTNVPGHYIWTINREGHQASFDIWASSAAPIFNIDFFQALTLPSTF
jgi:type VI secretion system protein ImpL